MRYFYSRNICQSLARHSKSTPWTQNYARRCLQINYAETHVPKPPIFSFKPANLTTSVQESNPPPAPTARVSAVVDELTRLTLLEIMELKELLRQKLGTAGGVSGGTAAAKAEEKAEKTSCGILFDLKLDDYDPREKFNTVKEVRACTSLCVRESKKLVENAPTVLKKGVPKEEAEKIIEKMKEVGAKVTMEIGGEGAHGVEGGVEEGLSKEVEKIDGAHRVDEGGVTKEVAMIRIRITF